jgi:hypothetical protein
LEVIKTAHAENYSVYGVKKMHAEMLRRGHLIGREQTRRLTHRAQVCGEQRSQKVFTTRTDAADVIPSDLAKRNFVATKLISCGPST